MTQPATHTAFLMHANGLGNQSTLRISTNSYTRPAPRISYRCGKLGHRSNIYLECRSINLVEDVANADKEGVTEDKDDRYYNEVEYAQNDGSQVSCVVQRFLYAT